MQIASKEMQSVCNWPSCDGEAVVGGRGWWNLTGRNTKSAEDGLAKPAFHQSQLWTEWAITGAYNTGAQLDKLKVEDAKRSARAIS